MIVNSCCCQQQLPSKSKHSPIERNSSLCVFFFLVGTTSNGINGQNEVKNKVRHSNFIFKKSVLLFTNVK